MDYVNREWATKMSRKNRANAFYNKKAQIAELTKAIVSNVEEGLSGITVRVGELDYSCILWAKAQGFTFSKCGNGIIIAWEVEGYSRPQFYDHTQGKYRSVVKSDYSIQRTMLGEDS